MNCLWCEEPILPEEVMPHAPMTQMHRECVLRSVLGPEAHHRRACHCFGGTEHDPVGASKRDAARLSIIEYMRQSAHTPMHEWPLMERVKLRPSNFESLSAEDRWSIDKALRILDWDGVAAC